MPGDAVGGRQVVDEVAHERALHAGRAAGADLFLIGQQHHLGAGGGALDVQERPEGGIAADPVVLAVGGDQAAVKPEVAGLEGGDDFQLGREEILLGDAVFLVEDVQDPQFDPFALVVGAEGAGNRLKGLTPRP